MALTKAKASGILKKLLGKQKDGRAATVFRDGSGGAYFQYPQRLGRVTVPLTAGPAGAGEFAAYYQTWKLEHEGTLPKKGEADVVAALLGAAARDGGSGREVFVRHAAVGDDLYVDLADADRRVYRITAAGGGWCDDCPVPFLRPGCLAPLPAPVAGGTFEDFRGLFPATLGREAAAVLLGWLLGVFHPRVKNHALILHGPKGGGKSVAARYLIGLCDPTRAAFANPLGGSSKSFAVAAANSRVVALDNVTAFTRPQQDELCKLVTGTGYRAVALYTDDREVCREMARSLLITTTGSPVDRDDLLDRAVSVEFPRLADAGRGFAGEADLDAKFEADRGRVVGYLFECLAGGLRTAPPRDVGDASRMVDAVVWGERCLRGAGFPPRTFADAVATLRGHTLAAPAESAPYFVALCEWLDGQTAFASGGGVTVGMTALYGTLTALAKDQPGSKSGKWPGNANALSKELRNLAPSFAAVGIGVACDRCARGGYARFTRLAAPVASVTVPSGAAGVPQGQDGPEVPAA